MKLKSLSILALSALLLAGCKTTVSTAVNYSDFFAPAAYVNSSLSIEIPACKDHESGFDSSSLLEVKNRVPAVFPKAKFMRCRKIEFNSYAEFSIPVRVGATEEPCGNSDICIMPEAKDSTTIVATTSPEFRDGYRRLQSSMSQTMETEIQMNVTNNTSADIPLAIISMMINGNPYHYSVFQLGKGQSADFTLSDVCTESILKGRNTVLFFKNGEKE
jgi:hypothetical protein